MIILDPSKYEEVRQLSVGLGFTPGNLPCLVIMINNKPYIFSPNAGKDIIGFITQAISQFDMEFMKHQFLKNGDDWIYIDEKGKKWNVTKTGQDTYPILLVEVE